MTLAGRELTNQSTPGEVDDPDDMMFSDHKHGKHTVKYIPIPPNQICWGGLPMAGQRSKAWSLGERGGDQNNYGYCRHHCRRTVSRYSISIRCQDPNIFTDTELMRRGALSRSLLAVLFL